MMLWMSVSFLRFYAWQTNFGLSTHISSILTHTANDERIRYFNERRNIIPAANTILAVFLEYILKIRCYFPDIPHKNDCPFHFWKLCFSDLQCPWYIEIPTEALLAKQRGNAVLWRSNLRTGSWTGMCNWRCTVYVRKELKSKLIFKTWKCQI